MKLSTRMVWLVVYSAAFVAEIQRRASGRGTPVEIVAKRFAIDSAQSARVIADEAVRGLEATEPKR